MRLEGSKHTEAMSLARKLEDLEQKIVMVRNDRTIVNFDYWRLAPRSSSRMPALSAQN